MRDIIEETIGELPAIGNKGKMKNSFIRATVNDYSVYLMKQREYVYTANTKLTDNFDPDIHITLLHPSLHEAFEQILALEERAKHYINLLNNFFTAVITRSKNYADYKALLPSSLHYDLSRIVEHYYLSLTYHCWLPEPTLSPEAIEAFRVKQQPALNVLKFFELNAMTTTV